jgi:hypothetical protein
VTWKVDYRVVYCKLITPGLDFVAASKSGVYPIESP